jgi:hypothetical protein
VKGTKPTNFLNAKKQPLRIVEEVLVFTEDEALEYFTMILLSLDFLHSKYSGGNKYITKKAVKTKGQQKEYKALAEAKRQRRCERNLRIEALAEFKKFKV